MRFRGIFCHPRYGPQRPRQRPVSQRAGGLRNLAPPARSAFLEAAISH